MSKINTIIEEQKKCVFCDKNYIKTNIFYEDKNVMCFEPLNPVIKGHFLVVPKEHINDITGKTSVVEKTIKIAKWIANEKYDEFNLITSKGKNATQSIFHFHIHIIPRKENDGLLLPWSETTHLTNIIKEICLEKQ